MVDYPKTLPVVETDTIPDIIGFTEVEKAALANLWRIIGTRRRKIAIEIFLDVFTQNERFLAYFRDSENKIDCENLHSHPKILLDTIGVLITEGVYDESQFKLILNKIVSAHQKHGVSTIEIEIMTNAIKKHLFKGVESFMSPTLKTSIGKIMDCLVAAHDVGVVVIVDDDSQQ